MVVRQTAAKPIGNKMKKGIKVNESFNSTLLAFFRDAASVSTKPQPPQQQQQHHQPQKASILRHVHPETLWIDIRNHQIIHHTYLNNMDENEKNNWPTVSYESVRIESMFVDRTQAVAALTFQDSSSSSVDHQTTTKIATVSLLKSPQSVNASWTIFTIIVSTLEDQNNNNPNEDNMDRQAIRDACMNQYLKSNRACDGVGMASVFHPLARLIQVPNHTPSSSIQSEEEDDRLVPVTVISQPDFCQLVQSRYESSQSPHAPYANLADKDRHDLRLGGALLGKTLAVGHLRMGHPPCVWTDLLILAKLNNSDDKSNPPNSDNFDTIHDISDENGTTWWILAKTSHAEPFFPDFDLSMLNP